MSDLTIIYTERSGSKTRASDRGKLFSISYDKDKYDYYEGPEFKFSTFIRVAKILIANLTDILNDFTSLEVMSSVIKIKKA